MSHSYLLDTGEELPVVGRHVVRHLPGRERLYGRERTLAGALLFREGRLKQNMLIWKNSQKEIDFSSSMAIKNYNLEML